MDTTYQSKTGSEPQKQENMSPQRQKITPFLWFDDKAGDAMNFYTSIFKNSRIFNLVSGPEGSGGSGTFELNGHQFIAMNAGPMFSFSPAISFFVTCKLGDELDQLWDKLSFGGSVLMPLDKYPFSKMYGWLVDKFGISWQLTLSNSEQVICPSLLFVGDQKGKAEEAIDFYTSVFPESGIDQIERYKEEDQDPAGTVKYASFRLHGQPFSAMDSHFDHQFTFTPAISFLVRCQTQEEVDFYWEKFAAGGAEERCGWLKDRYGISWQIIPDTLENMLSDRDGEKSNRAMQAMLQMNKIIISDLEQAYNNETPANQPQQPGSQDLIITRVFNLPVNKVWQAWTDPEICKKWWGPKDYDCTYASIDLREGGKYLSNMRSPEGQVYWSTGIYKEIVPNKKLVCTDSFADEQGNVIPASDLNMPGTWPMELLVTVTFEERDGRTEMRLVHQGLPPENLEDCKTGWQQSFDKLEANIR